MRAVPHVSSRRLFIHPSPQLTNRGAEFHQCPLLKHLHYGVLPLLFVRQSLPVRGISRLGSSHRQGHVGLPGPHQHSQADSPSLDLTAGQETNLCVCWQQLKVQCPHSFIYSTNRFFSVFNLVADQMCHQGWT